MSAYIVSALEEKMKPGDLGRMLDDMLLASGGPMTAKEKRDADRALGLAPKRAPRKAKAATSRNKR